MPAECQGPVSCPWGRKEWAGREEGKCCPPPCVAFRQALSGACIASNQAFAYKHISGQCAEEMLRGEDGGQGGAVNLAAQCKGFPAILLKANSVHLLPIASSHRIIEIRRRPVAFLSLLLLSRPGISHVALQLRPQFIHRTIARKTCRCHAQHKIGHGRIGGWLCLAHTHTHTRVVYRCISYPKHAPPHCTRTSGIGRSTGPRRGERGGGEGETRLRACPSGSSRAPVPATATAPAPDHGTSSSALWTERPSTYPRDLVSSPRLASRRGRSAACILIAMLRPSPARADRQSGSQHWTDTSWSWPWPQRPPLSPGSATRVRTTTGWCWCWCWC